MKFTTKVVVVEYHTVTFPKWVEYAMEYRKIDAIKELRSQCGLGLKEAKDVVETISKGITISKTPETEGFSK